jgi:hypothetical protein
VQACQSFLYFPNKIPYRFAVLAEIYFYIHLYENIACPGRFPRKLHAQQHFKQICYTEYHRNLEVNVENIIYIYNCNRVDTRWQQYITHLHTNNTYWPHSFTPQVKFGFHCAEFHKSQITQ